MIYFLLLSIGHLKLLNILICFTSVHFYSIPSTLVISIALLIGIFVFYLQEYVLATTEKKYPDAKAEGVGPLEGALLGLLALLLSFYFQHVSVKV